MIKILKKSSQFRSDDELNKVAQLLKFNEFIQQIDDYKADTLFLLELSKYLEHDYSPPHQTIYETEKVGDKFYIILEGDVGVFLQEDAQKVQHQQEKQISHIRNRFRHPALNHYHFTQIKVLRAGQSFGELQLISNRPRQNTMVAISYCHFATLRKSDFNLAIKISQHQQLLKELGFFAELQLFENWNIYQIRKVYQKSEARNFSIRQSIFHQYSEVDGFYIIKSGSVDLQYQFKVRNKVYSRKILTLGVNQILGLEDLLSENQIRQFSCFSSSAESCLIYISQEVFRDLIAKGSNIYIESFCQKQNEFWEQRVTLIQMQVKNNSKKQINENSVNREVISISQHDSHSLRINRQRNFNLSLTSLNKSIVLSSNRSYLQRERDHSLMGKVQTQKLLQRSTFQQLVLQNYYDQNQSSIRLDQDLSCINLRQPSSQKRAVFSTLNDSEKKIVSQIMKIVDISDTTTKKRKPIMKAKSVFRK